MSSSVRTLEKRWREPGCKPLLLGLDCGTKGLTVLAADAFNMKVLAKADAGYSTFVSDEGHVKQFPDHWKWAMADAVGGLVSQGIFQNARPLAIGISGQMHAGVWLDRCGQALDLASLWNCPRAKENGRRLSRLLGENVDGRLTISHIDWMLEHRRKWWREYVSSFTTPGGYLARILTGERGLDPCEHSGLGVQDIHTGQVSLEKLDKAGLREISEMIPPCIPAGLPLGRVRTPGLRLLGLEVRPDLLVAAPTGDQGAGRVGLGLGPKHAGCVLGTSGVLTVISQTRPVDPSGTVDFFSDSFGNQLNMGLIFNCMEVFDRVADPLQERFGRDLALVRGWLDEHAAGVPVNCHGWVRLDLPREERGLGLNQPVLLQNTPTEIPPEVCWRLAMVQVAHCLLLRLKALAGGGALPDTLVVGGGGSNNALFMQVLADYLNCRIVKPDNAGEASGLGALRFAALVEEHTNGSNAVSAQDFILELSGEPRGREWIPNSGVRELYSVMERRLDELIGQAKR